MQYSKKRIIVLGSTGSIGTQTLDIAARHSDKIQVVGLACYNSADTLLAQAQKFNVHALALGNTQLNNTPQAQALKTFALSCEGGEGEALSGSPSAADGLSADRSAAHDSLNNFSESFMRSTDSRLIHAQAQPAQNSVCSYSADSPSAAPGEPATLSDSLDTLCRFFGLGEDSILELVRSVDADMVVNSLVGAAGLRASIETLKCGKQLALANKESLVVGGDLIMPLAAKMDARRMQSGLRAWATRQNIDFIQCADNLACGDGDEPFALRVNSSSPSYSSQTAPGDELFCRRQNSPSPAPAFGYPPSPSTYFPAGSLVPIDSEHGAIFQCLLGEDLATVESLWVTASGGPFRGMTTADLGDVTPARALAHPTWNMGPKISIDSATLMNKGLEVIEAHHLFSQPYDKIKVVVQPQSQIHSMVEFADGSVKAHLGRTDMRIPIQFAISYPARWDTPAPRVDFTQLGHLDFCEPDTKTFKCLELARNAGKVGGTLPCAMNAANEVAVARFLAGDLPFLGISACVEAVMEATVPEAVESVEQLQEVDARARQLAREFA